MDYRDKKILLMGLGGFKKGSGVSVAEFLARQGADLTITDLKNAKELEQNLKPLKKYKNIKYVLGGHKEKDFAEAEWIIRNPDVPPSSPFLTIAKKRGIKIDNDITLFFREYGVEKVIGVTGTRGKSTTTSLIYAMIKEQFSNAKLGGNIGISPLRFLKELQKSKEPVVLELSNFQLTDLNTIKMSPHIAVWTNLYPDHLNKYSSIKEYQADKLKIFQYQKTGDIAILNWDNQVTQKIGLSLEKQNLKNRKVLFFSLNKKPPAGAFIKNGFFIFVNKGKETKICNISQTKLLGRHNLSNILAAICATKSFGVNNLAIKKAIQKFAGVPNRLEFVKELGGVRFYNDCTATSPQATIAGLNSFPLGKVILISGGNSKGSSLKEMAQTIAQKAKAVILMPGKVNKELEKLILNSLNKKNNPSIIKAETLKEAVKTSFTLAKKEDVVLFSPGLTWLPWQNEFVRGEEFKRVVKVINISQK